MEFAHTSVLLDACIEALRIDPDGVYVDGTAGGGGHSFAIASRLQNGRLIAIDRDPEAVEAASRRLAPLGEKARVVRARFSQMPEVLASLGIPAVNGILLDLGVSSRQFDEAQRGFSFHSDAPLDMRMSMEGPTAADLVNSASAAELARILREYGEEKFSSRIAAAIQREREREPVTTTLRLAEIVKEAIPAAARRTGGHPARRAFQALRIAVNGELEELSALLDAALGLLLPGGRLAVITFHSLEDRMVKQRFASWAQGCTCPPDFPVCVCGNTPRARLPYRKGVEPTPQELEENARSRSARLRVAEKI